MENQINGVQPQQNKSNTRKIILIILAVIFVIIFLCCGSFFILAMIPSPQTASKTEEDKKTTETTAPTNSPTSTITPIILPTYTNEEITKFASDYCTARKGENAILKYSVVAIEEGQTLNFKNKYVKTGKELTLDDCKENIKTSIKVIETTEKVTQKSENMNKYLKIIIDGEIWIGMHETIFLISYSNPKDINITYNDGTTKKQQLVYRNSIYFYFTNNKLESYQEF